MIDAVADAVAVAFLRLLCCMVLVVFLYNYNTKIVEISVSLSGSYMFRVFFTNTALRIRSSMSFDVRRETHLTLVLFGTVQYVSHLFICYMIDYTE